MNMTPRNIILLILAIIVGLVVGLAFPLIGLVLFIPVMGYVVFILLRNRGSAEASPEANAAAKQFTAPQGMAAIYVMRHAFVGGQQGMNLTIADNLATQFRTGRFARAEVIPGEHTVFGQLASQTRGTAATATVKLAAGECVLLDAKLNMGALQGNLTFLETRNPSEARSKLVPLKLVEWKTE